MEENQTAAFEQPLDPKTKTEQRVGMTDAEYPAASESHGPLKQQSYQVEFIYHTENSLDVNFLLYKEQTVLVLLWTKTSWTWKPRQSASFIQTHVKKIKDEAGDGKGKESEERGRSFKDSELKWRR